MKKKACKKRHITLVEMMIVMFLIAMITGVIAYNYTGSLEEGKAFKTTAGIEKIHTILDLHLASHPEERESIGSKWQTILQESPLVKNSKELINDGWGIPYDVQSNDGVIEIKSEKYNTYQAAKKGTMFKDKKNDQ